MTNYKIWTFMLLSVAIHIVVISIANSPEIPLLAAENPMNVRLVATSESGYFTQSRHTASRRPEKINQQSNTPALPYQMAQKISQPKKSQDAINTHSSKQNNIKHHEITAKAPAISVPNITSKNMTPVINTVTQLQVAKDTVDENTAYDDTLNKKRVLKYLQNELSRYFSYPGLASRRGWQGKVLLGFELRESGTIENIYIAKSSGYAILDIAASKSLAKVKQLTDTDARLTDWINSNTRYFQLPVIFQLQDS